MRLLLDTHALLWAIGSSQTLREETRDAIADTRNLVFASAVSAWEIVIKRQLGKLTFDGSVREHATASGFVPLSISLEHAEAVEGLPLRQGDPFDRLLVGQAVVEDATLVTRDRALGGYEVNILRA